MTFEDPASVAAVLGREHILDGKAVSRRRLVGNLSIYHETRLTPSVQFLEKSTCGILGTSWEGCRPRRPRSQ
jgi:hypothetical protein